MRYEQLVGEGVARSRFVRWPSPHGVLAVRGRDAVDFLQRLCSQDVAAMAVGESRHAAFLNPKGKLLATCAAGRGTAAVWLETTAGQAGAVAELLERYHFAEQLAVERRPDWVCGEVLGRDAPAAFGLEPGRCVELEGGGIAFTGARRDLSWVRYHAPAGFFAEPPWRGTDLPEVSAELAECLRIAAGLVAVGADTDASTLALEAGLDDHVSTDKGCYTGQEIVARIHTYGHLNRKLCVLRIDGTAAIEPGTALCEADEGERVGRAMTSAPLPGGGARLALGYLPRDFQAPGTRLSLGDASGPAVEVIGC